MAMMDIGKLEDESIFVHLRTQRGVTIVELMFGLVISMMLIAAGYTVLTTSQKAATVNDQTAEVQQNARVALELVTRDLKMAGFGMTAAVGNCTFAIVPADNTTGGADTGPDSVSLVVPTNLTTLAATATGTTSTITLQSGAVAGMTPDGFGVGATVSVGGVFTSTVSAVSGDTLTLATAINSPQVYSGGTQVYWLRCITYAIATTTTRCAGTAPCLVRGVRNTGVTVDNDANMVPVAEGVEDIQLAYACDGCNGSIPDGVVDDQNASNTFDTADFISNNAWTSSPSTPDTIRLVRVTVVARQIGTDKDFGDKSIAQRGRGPQAVEDHNPAQDAGYVPANYTQARRRSFTRTVQLRNVGLTT